MNALESWIFNTSLVPFPSSASEEGITLRQCCGSGSASIWLFWIRIQTRIGTDPYPGEEIWQLSCKSYSHPIHMYLWPTWNMLFTWKFNLLWMQSLTMIWIRIRIDPQMFGSLDLDPDPHWDKNFDPDPHWNQLRIHKTASLKKPTPHVVFVFDQTAPPHHKHRQNLLPLTERKRFIKGERLGRILPV